MSKENFENDEGYEECIVTFLDILGFRALLNSKSSTEITEIMTTFRRLSEPEEVEKVTRSAEVRLNSEACAEIISDAIVRVRTTETQYSMGPLIWELLDLLHIQIECVAKGILIRGATTVGPMHVGLNMDGPIFGPALVNSYEMEDSQVIYPRIAIDEALLAKHREDQRLRQDGNSYEDEESHLKKLLRVDDAGLHSIDYLRASLGELGDGFVGWVNFLERHKNLIVSGLNSVSNQSIRRKYIWMKNYHNEVVSESFRGPKEGELIPDLEVSYYDVYLELVV
ncbi:MAG: hypothetical protein JKY50_00955 [Oleispira sp.]|nr:hypothetical protein [Oleispira sp.]